MFAVRGSRPAGVICATVSGDDAYERYLAHHAAAHAGEPPLNPKEYFAEMQRRKWSGVSRCCCGEVARRALAVARRALLCAPAYSGSAADRYTSVDRNQAILRLL